MNNKLVYLSGPMSGYPNFNYDRFNEVALKLRSAGYVVINPAEIQGNSDNTTFDEGGNSIVDKNDWVDLLSRDLITILEMKVGMIVLLSGWHGSKGAKAELYVCQEVLGSRVYEYCDYNSESSFRLIEKYVSIGFNCEGNKGETICH